MEGRTPMPPKEKNWHVSSSMEATMCIFLSVQMLDKVAAELIEGGYDKTTPVAIVVKASCQTNALSVAHWKLLRIS